MDYYFSKVIDLNFNDSIFKVTEDLKKEGFGVLSKIDVKQTFKTKLDVDYTDYIILGACNPQFAHKALSAESRIGTMLPCNVIVRSVENGKTEISAVNPVASMQSVGNKELLIIADHIKEKLKKVISSL